MRFASQHPTVTFQVLGCETRLASQHPTVTFQVLGAKHVSHPSTLLLRSRCWVRNTSRTQIRLVKRFKSHFIYTILLCRPSGDYMKWDLNLASDYRGKVTFRAQNMQGLSTECTSLLSTFTTRLAWGRASEQMDLKSESWWTDSSEGHSTTTDTDGIVMYYAKSNYLVAGPERYKRMCRTILKPILPRQ